MLKSHGIIIQKNLQLFAIVCQKKLYPFFQPKIDYPAGGGNKKVL